MWNFVLWDSVRIPKSQYNYDHMVQNAVYLMELNVIGVIGIGVELNCLMDFVPESELNCLKLGDFRWYDDRRL